MGAFNAILNPLGKAGYGFIAKDATTDAVKSYVFAADTTQTIGGVVYTGSALRDQYVDALVGAGLEMTDVALGFMTQSKLVLGTLSGAVSEATLDASTGSVYIWTVPFIMSIIPSLAIPPYPLIPMIGNLQDISNLPTSGMQMMQQQ